MAQDIRMGRAHDNVDHIGMPGQDGRQGGDDGFNALVRREQAKAEQDGLAFHPKQILVEARVHKGDIRNAVRDVIDFLGRDAIDLLEEVNAALAHHDDPVGQGGHFLQHPELIGVGIAQNRVKGRHDRHAQIAQQGQDVAARPAAIDAILVLQTHQVHVVDVQKISGPPIRIDVFFAQLKTNARRIVVAGGDVIDRQGDAGRAGEFRGDGLAQVGGKGGDPALAGQIVADKADSADR